MSEIDKLRAEIDLLENLANDRDRYVQLLTDENNKLRSVTVAQETLIRKTEADNERLRAALCVCELELNAYYRRLYPGDHPYSQKELAKAMASNPATVALKENNND